MNAEIKKLEKCQLSIPEHQMFLPKSKYNVLTGNEDEKDLFVAKKIALATSKSFVFSKELLNCIRKNCEEKYHVFYLMH